MERTYTQEEKYIKAQKRVKDIKGFYAHLIVTILVIPFLIFINLRFVPQFHWFWFPLGGMSLGLLIHWLAVFGYKAMGLGKDWEEKKSEKLWKKTTTQNTNKMDQDYIKEQQYLKAKKRVKDIRGFYSHLSVYVVINIFISGVIIYGLTREDYSFGGAITHFGVYSTWLFWGIGLFFHWLGIFGFKNLLGKSWEEKKIKELMDEDDERGKKIMRK